MTVRERSSGTVRVAKFGPPRMSFDIQGSFRKKSKIARIASYSVSGKRTKISRSLFEVSEEFRRFQILTKIAIFVEIPTVTSQEGETSVSE